MSSDNCMVEKSLLTGILVILLTSAVGVAHAQARSIRLTSAVNIPEVGEGECVDLGPDGSRIQP